MAQSCERGQAAVEAALTLPLALFLVLGTLQLFLMLQARILAQYAVARATRAGSVDHAHCGTMSQVALAALLPSIARTDSPAKLGEAFRLRSTGAYNPAADGGRTEEIFWLTRIRPVRPDRQEEELFDLQGWATPRSLEVELVFWYPLRIPFANWVIAMLTAAQYELRDLDGVNPLMAAQRDPDWREGVPLPSVRGGVLGAEILTRTNRKHYALPIKATYAMRLMTPVRGLRGRCPVPIQFP